ncbi:MAG TPA: SsgA family sporulation/cell division regulator [Marmoricola sp.]|jgi:hypothetical protein|nr:SsgA family sporulation/cell division regulator [Marmoricola sp.]
MQKATTVAAVVTLEVGMELIDDEGTSAAIDTDLVYDPSDPFAATIVFKSNGNSVRWTFARDLLVGGLYEPTGEGDVHVWPCLASDGTAVVIVELQSPAGGVLVQAPTRDVHRFVTQSLASVPQGHELTGVDVDAALRDLLAG